MNSRVNHLQLTRKLLSISLFMSLLAPCLAQSQALKERSSEERISRVINGLRPSIAVKGQPTARWTLAAQMNELHVPGVSVAVMDHNQIAWARGFGVTDAQSRGPVTPSTLFEAQSISKAVTATAALALVRAGRVSLDAAANKYLTSWQIPMNEYQTHQQVTIRQILSHSAGFTVRGFEGYRAGDQLPTLVEVLDGQKPANSAPVRVDFVPGSQERYSGGGMEVLQQLLMDVSKEPFPELMQRLVLKPAGMRLSTYQQPLPQARWSNAASGHDGDGNVIKGRWPIHPEMSAAGLWTTPTDLARWALNVTKAWQGRTDEILSNQLAVEMLTVQKAPYGLGVELQGSGRTLQFSHAGSNTGFRAWVVMFPATGQGAVVMTNGDRGDTIFGNLVTSLASEYQWPIGQQEERQAITLSPTEVEAITGVYSLPPAPSGEPVSYEVTHSGTSLYGEIKGLGPRPKTELFAANPSALFGTSGLELSFTLDTEGRATTLLFGGMRAPRAGTAMLPASK